MKKRVLSLVLTLCMLLGLLPTAALALEPGSSVQDQWVQTTTIRGQKTGPLNFNIQGVDGDKIYQTSYRDGERGYRTVCVVDGNSAREVNDNIIAPGLRLNIDLETVGDNYIKVQYTLQNTGSTSHTVSLGTHADVMIDNNDKAPVYATKNGGNVLMMSGQPKNNYAFQLVATTCDTLWYGYFYDRYKNVFTNMTNRGPGNVYDQDSGVTWSWKDIVLEPGDRWQTYVLIGTADQDVMLTNQIPTIPSPAPPAPPQPSVTLSESDLYLTEGDALPTNWMGYVAAHEGNVTISGKPANSNTPGDYSVTYTATNEMGKATAKLTVHVIPKPASLTQTTATGSGPFTLKATMEQTGGLTFTETGFVYGAIQNPTLTMNDGTVKTSGVVKTKGGVLTATVAKTSLTEGITYYARAYAKTSDGTVIYGLQSVGFGLGVPSYGVFKITNNGNNTFTITRTGGTDGEQMVYCRTVNGSAVGGTHFKHKNYYVTFAAGETSKTIEVEEYDVTAAYARDEPATQYSNADRTYQVELYRVKGGGTVDPNQRAATRTMTMDSGYTIDRQVYVGKSMEIPASKYVNNGKTDHFEAWKNTWRDDQPFFWSTAFLTLLYGNDSTEQTYFWNTGDNISYYLTMSVYESYDCFGHIAFISGYYYNDEKWQEIKFDINSTGTWVHNVRFPFTSNQTGVTFTSHENNDLAIPLIDDNGGKAIQLAIDEHDLVIQCKASKKNKSNIGWFGKNLVGHARVIDKKEPQLLGIAPMAGGTYFPGDPVTISLVFDEIVDSQNSSLSKSSYISTSWGTFYYAGGVDTNVLYFTGTMPETTDGTISLTTLNCASRIKDMCDDVGTASAGEGSTTVGVGKAAKPTVSVGAISNSNGTLTSKITASNASKLEYVWSQSSAAPAAGWRMLANTSSSTVTTRQTSGTWYLHARATNSDGRMVYASKSFTIPTTGASAVALPDLALAVTNTSWAKTRAITVTRKPSTATVTVKTPSGSTATVSGGSYTATANGAYTFTLTSNGETVVKQAVVSKLDLTGPAITIHDLANTTHAAPVTLTFSVGDGESGVNSVTAKWNSTTVTPTKNSDGTYTVTSPNNGANGTWKLTVTATDKMGNSKTATSKSYTINNKAPTVTVTKQSESSQGVVYSYTVTTNGNTGVTVNLPDGTSSTALSGTFTLTEPGEYYVYVSDAVGHFVTSGKLTVAGDVDGVAPDVRLYVDSEEWTNQDVTVTVGVFEENGAPTVMRDETALTVKAVSGESGNYSGSFAAADNGTFTVTASDQHGNVSTAEITVANIDKTAPTIGTPTGNPTEWTAENVVISFAAADAASGVKTATVKRGDTAVAVTDGGDGNWSFTADSNGTYTITVADAVGNIATESVEVTKIDNAAPTLAVTGGDVGADSLELAATASSAGSGVTITVSKDGGAAEPLDGGTYTVTAAGTYTFTATTGTGLTAAETVHIYTVAFDSNGGGTMDSQIVVEGGKASKPDDPSRGFWYTFTGWKNGESVWNFETSRVTGDTTLVAQWEDVPHTYDLEVTAPVFEAVRYGYAQPGAKAITITSTGNTAATITDVALSGVNADCFTLTGTGADIAAGGKLETYALQPGVGLGVGVYTADITVTYHDGETVTDTVSFTVNKAVPVVTAPVANTLTYNGGPQALVAAGSAVGGEMWYSLNGDTYSTDIPTLTNAGDYTVYYKVVGGDNYEDVAAVPVSVRIAFKNITGTVTVSGTAAMAQTLTAEYTPGDPKEVVGYQWYRGDTAIEGATGSTYTIVADDVGSSIQVKASGKENYTGTVASKATTQVTPAKSSVTSWPTAGAITYGQTLSDSALTGGEADMEGAFTWADGTIQPAVSDSGTTEYGVIFTPAAAGYSAVAGKVTLTVNKATPAVTVAAIDGLTYTGSAQALVTGSTTGDKLQYSLNGGDYAAAVPTGTDAGNYTVSYKVVGGDNYNDVAEQSVTVTIARKAISGTAAISGKVYVEQTLTADYTPGVPGETVGYQWYRGNTAIEGATGRTYTLVSDDLGSAIHVMVSGTGNYTGEVDSQATEAVGKVLATVTSWPTAGAITYGQALSDSTLTGGAVSVDGTFTWTDGTIRPAISDSGKTLYSVTFTPKDTDSYAAFTGSVTVIVNRADPNLTAPVANTLTYNGSAQTLVTAGSAMGGELQYSLDGRDYSTTVPTGTNAGSYTVSYRVVGGGNYNDVAVQSITVTIDPKSITGAAVSLGDSLTYTGREQSQTVSRVEIDGLEAAYNVTGNTGTNAGTYTLTITGTGNFTGSETKAFTIDKAGNSITGFTCGDIVHGETPKPTATADFGEIVYTYSKTEDGEYAPWSGDGQSGTWYVKASVVGTDNYAGAEKITSFKETAQREDAPGASVDYASETLTGLTPGADYIITPAGGEEVAVTADEKGGISLREEWLGKPLSVVTKAQSEDHSDSVPQVLPTPARPAAPAIPKVVAETIKGKGDGGITGIDATMEYKLEGGDWQTGPGSLGQLPGGTTVIIRSKATGNSFAGETRSLTVGAGRTLTVSFNTQGGSRVPPITGLSYGDTATQPADPARSGYTFAGWYTEANCVTSWSFENKLTDNVTLYAKWEKIVAKSYTVTFDAQGGEPAPAAQTVTEGKLVTKPVPSPTRDGYDFVGWFTGTDGTTPWKFGVDTVSGDMTLYAQWAAKGDSGTVVTPENPVEIPGGGSVSKDPDTGGVTIAPPSGGGGATTTITPGGDGDVTVDPTTGEVTVPSGSTVDPGNGTMVQLPDGGKVDGGGSITLPDGGAVTTPDGEGGSTTITAPDGGGTIKTTEDGGLEVPGGSTVKTEKGPEITVPDGGGKVDDGGNVTVPGGSTVTIPDGEGGKTEITVPDGGEGTIAPTGDGKVEVPGGSTVRPGGGNGPEVTVPGEGGTVDGQGGVTVPGGSDVTITDGKGSETTVTIPEGGEGTITPTEDGKVEIPGGSTVKPGDGNGPEITVGDRGGKVDDSGSITLPGGGAATISDGNGGETEITLPSGGEGTITPTGDGKVEIPGGAAVKPDNGPEITVGDQGGTVDESGEVTLPGGGTATIPGGSGGKTEITVPDAGGSVKPAGDGKVEVPEGAAITTPDGAKITITDGDKAVIDPDGTVTLPNGGKVTVTTPDGKSQAVEVPADGKVDPDDYYTKPAPTPTPSHSSGGSTSTYTPTVQQPEHGKITVSPARPERGEKVTITITPEKGYEMDTVTVTDRNGKPIEVTQNADGTYAFTQPAGVVTVSTVMKAAVTVCPRDGTCPIHAFADVTATAWYHDGVHYCLENGLMEGYGGGKFGPDDTLSRGMLAQILYNMEERPAVSGDSPFDDVAPDAWYARAVTWAAAEGIVEGYGDGRFGPGNPITREQLAAMLWRYAQAKGDDVSTGEDTNILSYKDFDHINQWAIPALQWAAGSGVMNGKGNGILDPTGNATRAEAATMLQRFCKGEK